MNPPRWSHGQKVGFGPVKGAVEKARDLTRQALDEAKGELAKYQEALRDLKKP